MLPLLARENARERGWVGGSVTLQSIAFPTRRSALLALLALLPCLIYKRERSTFFVGGLDYFHLLLKISRRRRKVRRWVDESAMKYGL